MNLFTLYAKIALDSKEYEKGVETAKKSAQEMKSDIAKLAQEYRKQGMSMSDAMKKAHQDIDKSQYETSKNANDSANKTKKHWVGAAYDVSDAWKNTKKVLSTVAKVSVAALGTAAAGISALAKSAIDNYAEYEQLVGGVETLFKDSSDTVIAYAKKAYTTAGLSANNYMETVTSFSASLLQGLGGDTAKAADYADMAITDMADNANKFGTNISSIQYAYQGFAKNNYTMLDNLKLGYGGTQAEMARLVNESGVLGDTMTVTASTINQVSFDKIIEAIHVVQENMGVTGTTAKEASTTIQGSVASMKAAWENFSTGLADGNQNIDELFGNLIDSIVTVAGNLVPRIQELLPRLSEGITQLVVTLSPLVPPIIEQLLPALISGATSLVSGLIQQLPSILSALGGAFQTAVSEIVENVSSGLGISVDAFTLLASAIGGTIAAVKTFQAAMAIATVIQKTVEAVKAFKTAQEGATIAQAALNFVMNLNPFVLIATLIAGVVTALVVLWNTNEDFRNAVIEIWGKVKEFIGNVVEGIVGFFTQTIPNAISNLLNGIKTFAGNVKQAFENMKNAIATTVKNIANAIVNGFNSAIEFITSLPSKAVGWGRDFIQGLIDGIKSMISGVVNAVKGVADKITSFLHFSRPDEGPLHYYEEWMPDFMQGLADGINKKKYLVEDAVSKLSGNMSANITATTQKIPANTYTYGATNITVNAGNVQNPYQLAKMVSEALEQQRERERARFA